MELVDRKRKERALCVGMADRILDEPGLVLVGVGEEEVLHLLRPGQVQELQHGPAERFYLIFTVI
jgi:hypothetical protein